MAHTTLPGWDKPAPELSLLPTAILKRMLLHAAALDPDTDPEVLACHCLPATRTSVPYRCSPTKVTIDPVTKSTVRIARYGCPLDRGHGLGEGLGPWCVKQHLIHQPGKKRIVPALAMTNRKMFMTYRNAFVWVFCSEQCLEIAIRRLPFDAKNTLNRVRLLENEGDWVEPDYKFVEEVRRSREAYGFVGKDGMDEIVYVCRRVKRMVYHGQEVRVKNMRVTRKFGGVEEEVDEEEEQYKSKDKGKGKAKTVRFANDRDEGDGMYESQDKNWSEETTWNDDKNWSQDNTWNDDRKDKWENWQANDYDQTQPWNQPDAVDYDMRDVPALEAVDPMEGGFASVPWPPRSRFGPASSLLPMMHHTAQQQQTSAGYTIDRDDWALREALANSVGEAQDAGGSLNQEERNLQRALKMSVEQAMEEKSESPNEGDPDAKKRKSESPVEGEPDAKKRMRDMIKGLGNDIGKLL